jgi:3-hydroxybutyrate dehydrogenase
MTGLLAGKVALVTGAARGIGREIAIGLAGEGARIVMADLDGQAAQSSARLLLDLGAEAIGVDCDVTDEEQIRRTIDETVQLYGTLDILVNNAGLQHVAPIEDFPAEVFERMIRVMLIGPFLGMKYAVPHMKRRGWGRILSIASINGLVGFAGKAAYNSAKHGVIGLTKVAALELAPHGITVNALCPGYVDTPLVRGQLRDLAAMRGISEQQVLDEVIYPLVPQRRLLEPREVADYAVFLASEKSRSVTGQAVIMDAGYTAQ